MSTRAFPLVFPLLVLAVGGGCDEVEASADGLSDALYNPCGPDVAEEDCQGGKPPGQNSPGTGIFIGVTGSRGIHELGVDPLGCTLRMDSVGTAITSPLCPDCSLILEMSHIGVDDACGVGTITYTSTVGLLPAENGEYAVYVSINGDDWYAVGAGSVDPDGVLWYEAASVYDAAYLEYGAAPAYTFTGEHTLRRD